MTDYSQAVQAALYSALTSPAISGVVAVIDHADATPSGFPFVIIEDSQIIPDDAVGANGSSDGGVSEFVDLHIWSRKKGQKEVKTIAAVIYDRLHGVSLSVAGRTSALCWVRSRRTFQDPDGLTRHGIVSIEIIHRS